MRALIFAALIALSIAPTIARADDEPDDDGETDAEEFVDQGSFELGGTVSASYFEDVWVISVAPTFGYFVIDRLELSLDLNFTYIDTDGDSAKTASLLFEPSYHHPISENLLFEVGVGLGPGYNGDDWEFDIVPEIGLNILTSRSNVITPMIQLPIRIGKAYGSDGDTGSAVGVMFEIGITTTW